MAKMNKKQRKQVIKTIMDKERLTQTQASAYFDNLNYFDKRKYIIKVK